MQKSQGPHNVMRKSPFKIISAYVRNDCWISVSGAEKKKKPYTVEPGNKELFGHQTVVH